MSDKAAEREAEVRALKIRQLSDLKPDQFVLRDKLDYVQQDVENWGDAMGRFQIEDSDTTNFARLRRYSLQAAYETGWFIDPPELTADDFVLLSPVLVSSVGTKAMSLFNEIMTPDPSFT